ncbi:MAG TPA: hypothetical protein VNQ74_01835, partial [Burkholderiaceae bacterium]|nr:hypothetical protein [Burkholderiaceae bacterium]
MKVRLAVYTLVLVALAPIVALAAPPRAQATASELSAADQAFLAARDAVRIGDRERLAQAATRLAHHPLAVYVEYWQLLAYIRSTEPRATAEVAEFMNRHAGSYIADRLRFDLALALASRGDYQGFEREAAQLAWWTDDVQFRCYAALSKYRRAAGKQADALAREARQLLANTANPAGEGCLALTEA